MKTNAEWHDYYSVTWQSINLFSFLYQTASLANIFFFAVLTNNNINKVPTLAIKFTFQEKYFIHSLNEQEEAFNKYGEHAQFLP